jgi:hypothetical protein
MERALPKSQPPCLLPHLAGELTPGEAISMLQVVEGYCRTIVASDFELRLSKLEEEKP